MFIHEYIYMNKCTLMYLDINMKMYIRTCIYLFISIGRFENSSLFKKVEKTSSLDNEDLPTGDVHLYK
jgi:hypothetical protein